MMLSRDTTPQIARMPDSFTGPWLQAGGLEAPRARIDLLADPTAPPESPRYRTLRRLGRGGGAVWLVHDVVLDREVAMKILASDEDFGESPDARANFLCEARLAGSLGVRGAVPVHDAGILPDGRCFFTMQHIAGPTLAAAIEARSVRAVDALGLRSLLGLFAQVCRTMSRVHAQGISHRGLKPANILVGGDGEAYIIDWGLAGPSHSAPAPAGRGGSSISGTLHYMAPEQLTGAGCHLGPVSDVYSLGVCLFEVLTGTTPHLGATAVSLMFQIRNVDAPDPRFVAPEARIAPELAIMCNSALARDPARRHLTSAALADRLERWLQP